MVRLVSPKAKQKKSKPGMKKRLLSALRSRGKIKPKPKRKRSTTMNNKDDKKPAKGKEPDPMSTPPDEVYAPSQLPSDLDPEAGKEKK